MTHNPSQAECHRLANALDDVVKMLRDGGPAAFALAADWSGRLAATAPQSGSRSTMHNDVSTRIVTPGERDIDDTRKGATLRVPTEFQDAHERMTANLATLQRVVPVMVRDLTFCQRAVATKREAANNLHDVNRRHGECETCYEAGRQDSYQDGTDGRKLEVVTIERLTVNRDADVTHEQLDLCHRCAVSCRGSRAAARSAGTDWSVDDWTTQRVDYLRTTVAELGGAA